MIQEDRSSAARRFFAARLGTVSAGSVFWPWRQTGKPLGQLGPRCGKGRSLPILTVAFRLFKITIFIYNLCNNKTLELLL